MPISFAVLEAKRNTLSPRRANHAEEGMKGLIIGPAGVAIVWAASIAIVWAVLTMQPARPDAFAGVDRHHFGQLRFFPLR